MAAPRRPGDHRRRAEDGTDRWRSRSRWSCSSTRSRSAARWYGSSNVQRDVPMLDRALQGGHAEARRARVADDRARPTSTTRSRRWKPAKSPARSSTTESDGTRRSIPTMQYRRFGNSDLVVSEVGFGTWTLVTDWWGRSRRPAGDDRAPRSTPGINFIDTAPVYGDDGVGETLLADVPRRHRDDIVLTTKCGYDITAERKFPGPVGAPARLATRSRSASSRGVAAPARHRPHRPLPAAQHAHRADPRRRPVGRARRRCRREGKVRELGVALGPAIGWVEEGTRAIDDRPIVSLQTVFNVLEQEPGLTFARRAARRRRRGRPDLARAARVRHALGQGHARHRVRPEATTARTATATTCSTTSRRPRRCRSSGTGHRPHDRPGRDRRRSSPTPRSRRVLPTCVTVDDVREYAAASDLPLTADETRDVDDAVVARTSITTTATRCR